MKIEITTSAVTWVIDSTDGITSQDFVSVISSSSISTHKFIELYYDFFTETQSAKEAYEKTEALHVNLFSKPKYSDYESFKARKSYLMKK